MRKETKNPSVKIKEAAQLSGLTIDMITYLGRTDILRPSEGGGRGSSRLYTFCDVLFLKVIADLLASGIEVKRLKAGLTSARSESSSWIDIRRSPSRYLISDGTEIFVRRKGELESKTFPGQLAFAFVLDLQTRHQVLAKAWPHKADRQSRTQR